VTWTAAHSRNPATIITGRASPLGRDFITHLDRRRGPLTPREIKTAATHEPYPIEKIVRPEEFEVMFSVELDPDLYPSAREASDRWFESLLTLVVNCQRAGLLRHYESRAAARIAWAQGKGITELARRRQFGFKSRKKIVDFTPIATAALVAGAGHYQNWPYHRRGSGSCRGRPRWPRTSADLGFERWRAARAS
jgi:hypothetical protein